MKNVYYLTCVIITWDGDPRLKFELCFHLVQIMCFPWDALPLLAS